MPDGEHVVKLRVYVPGSPGTVRPELKKYMDAMLQGPATRNVQRVARLLMSSSVNEIGSDGIIHSDISLRFRGGAIEAAFELVAGGRGTEIRATYDLSEVRGFMRSNAGALMEQFQSEFQQDFTHYLEAKGIETGSVVEY